MEKMILISVDLVKESNYTERVITILNNMIKEGNAIRLYSRDSSRFENIKQKDLNPKIRFINRKDLNQQLKQLELAKKGKCIVVGRKDKDFELAIHNKLLYIVPNWMSKEDKPEKYGVKVDSPEQLYQFIKTINNQNTWYSQLEIDDKTSIISLADTRTFDKFINSTKEKEVLNKFKDILKHGSRNYYEMFLYHFLSSISNSYEMFYDINIWGCFPSSSGDLDNNEMFYFKENVRKLMGGQPLRSESYKKHPNILVRHTPTTKSHEEKNSNNRISEGAKKHFDSMCLHPAYKGKIKDKNICIFDDYLTHGNSFEAARNLLRVEDVNRIIFVSLGRFTKPYQYQEYSITGDVYSKQYHYKLLNRKELSKEFIIDYKSKSEIENLYNIFNISK
ncbi:hypothetical protein CS063_00130 [Sporanaerobium hydrogeniformans]|uniref:Uncharacterized protein n=1 Tax=Sporanaerobium hydrogeniformans TaxID=3072179 RepID=A0AC61DF64_9FIRM|nr:phosphoribosyltransferase [Sporanaerobium hydrogeniformans]PHV71924.1 hypothetical protein CS063_00130 [Sporanaerobium hydrogeniformans]